MPPAQQHKSSQTIELQPNEELAGVEVRVEIAPGRAHESPNEAALAALIQKARRAALQSVGGHDQPLTKITGEAEATANVPTPSTSGSEGGPGGVGEPEGGTTPETTPEPGTIPPQATIPEAMPGGQVPQEDREGPEGEEQNGESDEGSEEGATEEGGDEEKEGSDENNETAQQSELESDKAAARKEQGTDEEEKKDQQGDEGEGDDNEADGEGMGNPEEAFVFGSRASLTASFEELPLLLKANVWPLVYIHMHFVGYFLLPDLPFLALIPYLQTKLKFEKPNALQTVGFVILALVEFLIFCILLMVVTLIGFLIYAYYSVATHDWDAIVEIYKFMKGLPALKLLFEVIKGTL